LGAVTGLASQGLDLDGALPDLGDFALKQPPDELGVRAGEDDLDGGGGVADFEDEGLDALALLMIFAGDLLGAGHDAFDASEVDDHGAALEAGDGAGDDGADAVLEFLVNAAALVLADELDHDLLGGLGGDAAELGEGDG